MQSLKPARARSTFERTAPFYDRLTAHHDYDRWIPRLLVLAKRSGLCGTRLLDVACGTGKSFLPLLRAGWSVAACDVSPAMLRRARSKAGGQVRLELADMRHLPRLGQFDLVWTIDDAVNYLRGFEELTSCLSGMAQNLDSGGRILFDTNTLHMYRTFYSQTQVFERGRHRLIWRGHGDGEMAAGGTIAATFRVEGPGQSGEAETATAIHRQRHFPAAEVRAAMDEAGIECLSVMGHGLDGNAESPLDEHRHTKAIFIGKARKRR